MRLPVLLNSDLTNDRRISPVSMSLTLNKVPLSVATMQLPEGDEIPERSWVEIFTPKGSAGIFRAREPESSYGETITRIELEHGITEVGDSLITEKKEEQMALNEAMAFLFSFYKGSLWQMGSIPYTDSVVVDVEYDNVLEAMIDLIKQTDYMMVFNFSTRPWTFSLAPVDTTVTAEGRLSRNVDCGTIKNDDSELATRVYAVYTEESEESEDSEESDEEEDEEILIYEDDSYAISQYGLIERKLSNTYENEEKARAAARRHLSEYNRPKFTITINGEDLSQLTGESLDSFDNGKRFRFVFASNLNPVEDVISSVSYPDLVANDYNVVVTIGDSSEEYEYDYATKKTKELEESVKKSNSRISKNNGEIHKKLRSADGRFASSLDFTASHLRLEFTDSLESMRGELEMTASHLRTEFTDIKNSLRGEFEMTASHLRTEFLDVKNSLRGELEMTASHLRTEFEDTANSLRGEFEMTASHLRTEFDDIANSLRGEFEVTASHLRTEFDDIANSLHGEFEVTASGLHTEFEDIANSLRGELVVTASGLRADFENEVSGLRGEFQVSASGLRSEFENKISSVRSSISQQADRISLVVEGTGSSATIKRAAIVAAINGNTSSVNIEADKIALGSSTVGNIFGVTQSGNDTYVTVNGDLYADGGIYPDLVSIGKGGGYLRIWNYAGSSYADVKYEDLDEMIIKAAVSGNTLTLWKRGSNTSASSGEGILSFSKAVTLSGAWDGNRKFSFGESLHNQTRYTTIVSSVPKSDISWSGKSGTATLKATIGDSESTVDVGTVNVNGDVPYESGWSEARNSVVGKTYTVNSTNYNYFPTTAPSTKLQYMKCCQPNSTSGNTNVSAYTYYITSDNDYAYIRYGNTSGPIVAQYNHGKYTAGYNANDTAYATVTKASLSPGESSTISVYFKNAAGSTQNTGRTYTVSARALNLKESTFESAAAKQTFYVPSGYDGYGTITINAFDLSGYKTNAAYEAYGNSRYAAGSPLSGTVGSHRSAETWTFNIKKGDQTTTSLAIDCANIYTAARSGYYSSSQYSTAVNNARESGWSRGYSDGSPISGYVDSHRSTTVWSFQINKGDNTTTTLAIDCASIYTAARSGYYTQAQYDENFNQGWYAYYDSSYWETPSSNNGYVCKVPARNEYAKVTWFKISDIIGIWADDFALLGQQAAGDAINAFTSGCYQLCSNGYVASGYYYKFSISAGGKKVWYWFKAG